MKRPGLVQHVIGNLIEGGEKEEKEFQDGDERGTNVESKITTKHSKEIIQALKTKQNKTLARQ
jgi:hypothetical protein